MTLLAQDCSQVDRRRENALFAVYLHRHDNRTEVHPLYKPGVATHHDIALVRLSRPVDFRREEFVRPVCLPVTRENLNLRLDGQALVAAGWGLTEDNVGSNDLKDVILTVVPISSDSG